MASAPVFAVTPVIGKAELATGEADRTGATTTNIVTCLTAGASGTKVNEIVVKAEDDPADSIVLIFLHNGTENLLFDEFDLGNPADGSTTVVSYRDSKRYENLVLPTGWSIRCAVTVTPTTSEITVFAFGADL